ncbi:hypothetical protein AN639_05520 [Candidatus Epulonipiscium fishelsonii]|uniref:Uncharacterized protein n=1 Tax=Candidatus Epulonipiscium fishelsonii TaxID=77094 RepID=A0ACC8X9E2_9FIRM|nr:hypothetical protein AN396_10065 [Epulopiscium sp. SCG-B11WGA-EpuloA1]ONI40054.1 hypothetical protein AN639_05520 [Epulopiscium sp. SCG-B05WGA-EpuloA1]ONI47823.1 hypothetical protein AN644_03760 [Epulopiscium sp. SCG-C06WGA-EpuloA1]
MDKKSRIISFINMKGGVGKTTLTINVAKRLSSIGNNVLVIDTDPQFNATQSLLAHKEDVERTAYNDELNTTIYENLMKNNQTLLQLFQSLDTTVTSLVPIEIAPNLDLLAGDLRLVKVITGDTTAKVGVIDNYLDEHNFKSKYDYILIDCSPMWSILTYASLTASNYYVIPSKVDFHASLGIQLLRQTVKENVLDGYLHKTTKKKLVPIGVVFTLTNQKTKIEQHVKDALKAENTDLTFFKNSLPYMASAPNKFTLIDCAKPITRYASLKNSIEKITDELISRINEIEAPPKLETKNKQPITPSVKNSIGPKTYNIETTFKKSFTLTQDSHYPLLSETLNTEDELLENIIKKINDQFGDNFTAGDKVVIETLYKKAILDTKLLTSYDESEEIFEQNIFPQIFQKIVQQCYIEHIDFFSKLFGDKDFSSAIMEELEKKVTTV